MILLVVAEIPESAGRSLDVEREILGSDVEISRFSCDGDEDALVDACKSADVVLTDYAPFSRGVIAQLPNCRLISVAATGYSTVDVGAAKDNGISVCAIDEYCTDEVADHTITLILALCRRLMEYHEQVQRESRWQFDSLTGLLRLKGRTLGIVGFGRIGKAVARRASAFGLRVIAYDPIAGPSDGVIMCSLDELFDNADIVSLHCALTAENAGLIDRTAFQKMSRKPILINVARGGLVNEQDLVDALDEGLISAAGLDVLVDESPDLPSTGLRGRDNVVLTPHIAFYSDESMLENRTISASNIRHFLDGKHDAVRKYIHHALTE